MKDEKMNNQIYSIKSLIKEHDDYQNDDNYEFHLVYYKETNELITKLHMPSRILSQGIAFALANIDISDDSLYIYFDEIRKEIKNIRNQQK